MPFNEALEFKEQHHIKARNGLIVLNQKMNENNNLANKDKDIKVSNEKDDSIGKLFVNTTLNPKKSKSREHRESTIIKESDSSQITIVNDSIKTEINNPKLGSRIESEVLVQLFKSSGEKFIAIINYVPQNIDEIKMDIGDIIMVLKYYDDGWALGFNVISNMLGLLPLNYLKKLKPKSKDRKQTFSKNLVPVNDMTAEKSINNLLDSYKSNDENENEIGNESLHKLTSIEIITPISSNLPSPIDNHTEKLPFNSKPLPIELAEQDLDKDVGKIGTFIPTTSRVLPNYKKMDKYLNQDSYSLIDNGINASQLLPSLGLKPFSFSMKDNFSEENDEIDINMTLTKPSDSSKTSEIEPTILNDKLQNEDSNLDLKVPKILDIFTISPKNKIIISNTNHKSVKINKVDYGKYDSKNNDEEKSSSPKIIKSTSSTKQENEQSTKILNGTEELGLQAKNDDQTSLIRSPYIDLMNNLASLNKHLQDTISSPKEDISKNNEKINKVNNDNNANDNENKIALIKELNDLISSPSIKDFLTNMILNNASENDINLKLKKERKPPSLLSNQFSNQNDSQLSISKNNNFDYKTYTSPVNESTSLARLKNKRIHINTKLSIISKSIDKVGFLKISFVGDSGIGKTSLIKKLLENKELYFVNKTVIPVNEKKSGYINLNSVSSPTQTIALSPMGNTMKSINDEPSTEINEYTISTKSLKLNSYLKEIDTLSKVGGPKLGINAQNILNETSPNIVLIDTPGFGSFTNALQIIEPIVKYHSDMLKEAIRTFSKTVDKSVMHTYLSGNKKISPYVEVCTFCFLHRVKNVDVEYMKKLSKVVNIIPVILKSDTMDIEALFKLKKQILTTVREHKIDIFTGGLTVDELIQLIDAKVTGTIPYVLNMTESVDFDNFSKTMASTYHSITSNKPTIDLPSPIHSSETHLNELSDFNHGLFYLYPDLLREAAATRCLAYLKDLHETHQSHKKTHQPPLLDTPNRPEVDQDTAHLATDNHNNNHSVASCSSPGPPDEVEPGRNELPGSGRRERPVRLTETTHRSGLSPGRRLFRR